MYGRIGKAPLIRAIGIQKNHKEVVYTETRELDRIATGCFSCANYKNIEFFEYMPAEIQEAAQCRCNNCPYATYKTVTHETYKYVNEKNRFGFSPRLKSIALKLLLIYHFSNPDENGIVKDLSPKDLSIFLGCTVRSIRNANDQLQKYGYIMHCSDPFSKNHFQILLPEYKSYSLSAEQGGRGYATFNLECLEELVKIKSLNQLRIFIRIALEIDTNRNCDSDLIISKDMQFFRRFLPQYCKPGVIRDALNQDSNVFSIAYDGDTVYLKMKPSFHGRRNFESNNRMNSECMEEYISKIDEVMYRINNHRIKNTDVSVKDIEFLENEGLHRTLETLGKRNLYVPFKLQESDYQDLGLLCTSYSVSKVKDCIRYIYNNYSSQFHIDNFGGLVRTVLSEKWGHVQMSLLPAIQ